MENLNNVQPQQTPSPAPAARGDQSKAFAIIAYIPLFFLVGLCIEPEKNNPFVKNHVNNGIFITILGIVASIFSALGRLDASALKFIFYFAFGIVSVIGLTLIVIGISEAAGNKYYKIPLIGDAISFVK